MSTRVEKGTAKFKPILKAKTRPFTTAPPEDRPQQSNVEPIQSLRAASAVPTSGEVLSSMTPRLHDASLISSTPSQVDVSIQPAHSKPVAGHPIAIGSMRSQTPALQIIPTRVTQPFREAPPPPRAVPFSTAQAVTSPKSNPSTSLQLPSATSALDETPAEFVSVESSSDSQAALHINDGRLTILQAKTKQLPPKPKSGKTFGDSGGDDGITMDNVDEPESLQKDIRSLRKKTVTDPAENSEKDPPVSQSARPRAKRKRSGENNEDAENSDNSPAKRRRRKKPDHSPAGTPDPIDPTKVTMNSICIDSGSGRVSSRWESSQVLYAEARKRAKEEREQAIAEAEAKEQETGRFSRRKFSKSEAEKKHENGEVNTEGTDKSANDFSYEESLKASHFAPQVRIGANGEVVLDVESLQVDRAADPDLVEEYSHVEETDQSRFTNSNSWSKRRTVRWSKEDTALFYDALRQFGQNFDLIARILPGRTYRMCKNKFKAEDKKNPALIDDALRNRISVDLAALARMTGKDFTGPTPVIEARKPITFAEDRQADPPEQISEAVVDAQPTTLDPETSSPPPPESLLNAHVSGSLETGDVPTLRFIGVPARIPISSSSPSRRPQDTETPPVSAASATVRESHSLQGDSEVSYF